MRSQIQPHFIYNTLSAISELCMTQPQKAMEVLRSSHSISAVTLMNWITDLPSDFPVKLNT